MMAKAIFVTGGAGFVGQQLLSDARLAGRRIVALDRSGTIAARAGLEVVRGDLLDPASYRQALTDCDTVVHLAAATGKASRDEHFRINKQGTETLIDAARAAGVTKFLFVSSIATTFANLRGYHYAEAKVAAEDAVRRSGLRFAILRPTIIWGPRAPIRAALEKLALLPMIALPGSGRARVQPIHVNDVAAAIATVVNDDMFADEVFEIGGADVVSMEELLQRIRRRSKGQTGRIVRVPLGLMRPPLSIAEAAGLGRVLPLTAGQLSSFQYDGVARPNRLQDLMAPRVATLDQMLGETAATPVPAEESLDAECRVFTRHLIGADADEYIRSKYAAHVRGQSLHPRSRFDRTLLAFATKGTFRVRLADSYAAVFAPASTLRKRLVLLLAILETSRSSYRSIDAALSASSLMTWVRVMAAGLSGVITLIAGCLVFLPLRLMQGTREDKA